MAKIVLNVESNIKAAQEGITSLTETVREFENQFNNIKLNENVTEQIKSLTEYYKQFTITAQEVNRQQIISDKSVSSVETLRKSVSNLIGSLKTLEQQYPENTFKAADGAGQTYRATLKSILEELDGYSAVLRKNEKLDDDQIKRVGELSQQYRQLAADVAKAKAQSDKLQTADPFNGKIQESVSKIQSRYANLLRTIQSLQKYYAKGTFDTQTESAKNAISALQQYNQTLQSGVQLSDQEVAKLNNLINGFGQLKSSVDTAAASNKNYHGSIQDIVQGFLKFQLSAVLVMKPLQLIKNAISSINETLVETEDAVIEIKRVLNDSGVTNGEISSELYKIAINLGQTYENVSEIATNFAKTGMSWSDTLKATEAAVLALNVAELSADESSEGLIAVMQQFGYEASDLINIIDLLNATADNAAVTTEELLTALQKTGSSASAAGLSLENTVAIIKAMSEATAASGQNIGNAIKSLLVYSSKDSSLSVFASLSDDMATLVDEYKRGVKDISDVWAGLSSVMQDMSADQATLLEQWSENSGLETELGSALYEIEDELTGVYDTAGTYRRNYFIALLNNMDSVTNSIEEMSDVAGYSAKENETYMDSYTAKANALQAQWEDIANDEQGILGFKKNLVTVGSWLLTAIKYTGGLTTSFTAAGAALNSLIGSKIATWLAKQITSWSSLARSIKTTATPAIINYTEKIRQLEAEIRLTVDDETLLAKKTELLALKQQRLGSAFTAVSKAVSAALVIISVVNAIQGAIDQAQEDAKEKREEELRLQNEAIAASVESVDNYKQLVESTVSYASKVESLRKALNDYTTTESERAEICEELLSIQNALVEINSSYADSLNLVNGKLSEQLELVSKLSEEKLKNQAQEFLDENYAQIANANNVVNGQSTVSVELLNGTAFDNPTNGTIINELVKKAQEQGIEIGTSGYVDVPTNWTTPIVYYEELIRKAANGQETTVWDWTGLSSFKNLFTTEGWAGSSWSGISASGTVEEQLEQLNAVRQFIIDSYEDLGLSYDESVSFVSQLDTAIEQLDTEEYRNAEELANKAQATQDYLDGIITKAEYLEKVYGISADDILDLNEGLDDTEKKLEYLTDGWSDVVDKLKEYKELNEQALTLQEKQLAVEEAKKALEEAKNARGILRVGESGRLEVQQDEKEIASAEETLQKAIDALNEYVEEQAYAEIEAIEEGNQTNKGILEILAKWASEGYGEGIPDWLTDIIGYIHDETGVDLTGDENYGGTVGALSSKTYDSGGIAYGKGIMVKDTERPELVLNPDLTKLILTPTSNDNFERALANLGIMYETGEHYQRQPQVISNASNSVTTTNDNRVYINGMQLTQEQSNQVLELFSNMGLVQH